MKSDSFHTDISVHTPTSDELTLVSQAEPGGGAGIATSHKAAHLAGRVFYGVAWSGSTPYGSVVLDVSVTENCPELKHLFVDPHARRRGAARALMEWAEARARESGYKRIYFGVDLENTGARRLYTSRGYTTTGSIETTEYKYPGPDGTLIPAIETDEIFVKDLTVT